MSEQPWYLKNYKDQFKAKSTNRLISKVEAAIAIEQADRNSKRDTKHLHSSEMSKDDWCPRSTWYKIMDTEESDPQSMNLKRMNIFAEGHNIHDKWQRWMWKTGCLWGNWGCNTCSYEWEDLSPHSCPLCSSDDIRYREVPLSSERYRIIGHADGVWQDDRGKAVVEIKSIGLGTIRWDAPKLYEGYENGELSLDELWKRIKRPLTTHRRQVSLYMLCLGIEEAIVIYEWKPSQDVKEFHLKFEPEVIKDILAGADQVIEAVDSGVIPPKPVKATHKSCSMCKFCNYKTECWSKK